MNFLQEIIQNISSISIVEWITYVLFGSIAFTKNKDQLKRKIGFVKVVSGKSKLSSYSNNIINISGSTVLLLTALFNNNILLVVPFVCLFGFETINLILSLKKGVNEAVLSTDGIEINGSFLKFKKADACYLEGNQFHYIKKKKHIVFEIENENLEELISLGFFTVR